MADHQAIAHLGISLRNLLQAEMNETFQGTNHVTVTLDSPKKIEEDQAGDKRLSVFLFKILENADLKNRPFTVVNANESRRNPLTLDLCYMLTPYGADEVDNAAILGRAMQILYQHAMLAGTNLQRSLAGLAEQFRISMTPMSQEIVTQVWQALQVAARISVFYLVTPVLIELAPQPGAERVKERNLQ